MKKNFIFMLCIIGIIIAILYVKYLNYKTEYREIKTNNLEYEKYLNKEVLGTELTTIINKAVDNNEKNSVPKDEQGFYVTNDINSVKIQIQILDNETMYDMEILYNGGMERFVQNYNSINFECTKIEYNKAGKVSYMLFKQKNI